MISAHDKYVTAQARLDVNVKTTNAINYLEGLLDDICDSTDQDNNAALLASNEDTAKAA